MAIQSFSHTDWTSETGDRRPDTPGDCFAVHWTDKDIGLPGYNWRH